MFPKRFWFAEGEKVIRTPRRAFIKAVCICLVALSATSNSLCLAAPQGNPMWHQSGTQIIDGSGHRVELHGVNLGGWLLWEGWIFGEPGFTYFSRSETQIHDALNQLTGSDAAFRRDIYHKFIAKEDIHQIAVAGFNIVRVPLNYRLFATRQPQWEVLDNLLTWCEAYHVHVVLDLHGAPGGQSSYWTADPGHEPFRLWDSESYKSATVSIWRRLAARYKNREIVAGYDLLNEPDPRNGNQLRDLDQRIVSSIRQVDPSHLIIVEGSNFSTDFSMFEKPLCRNMAYSPHVYRFPWGGDSETRISGYNAIGHKQNTPLWIGEFGEDSRQWIDQRITQFKRYDAICGWDFWTWKKTVNGTAGLVTVRAPDRWKATLNWARYPFLPRPAASDVEKGMSEFLRTVSASHQPDKDTLIALQLRRK
jgi:endoglucanase